MHPSFKILSDSFAVLEGKAGEQYRNILEAFDELYLFLLKSLSKVDKVEDVYRLQGQVYLLEKILQSIKHD